MLDTHIARWGYTIWGTFGTLTLADMPFGCKTLEPRWVANWPNLSCIPPGAYPLCLVKRSNGEETYEIQNVPGRTAIRFDVANVVDELLGCVALGRDYSWFSNKVGLSQSQHAFEEFMQYMKRYGGEEAMVTISEHLGGPGR